MALEGTHMRFALDVQEMFDVVNVNKYIAGTIYPDSRYPSGIDRTLTHDDSQMNESFWKDDDFRKGWAAHLLYDKIQYSVHTDRFKHILKDENVDMTGEEDWIVRTALKILQDVDDVAKFDIGKHLNALEYTETPNGEDDKVMQKYSQLLIDIYGNAPNVTIEDLEQMWVDWSVPKETAKKMSQKSYEIKNDPQLMELVTGIYEETLRRKEEFFNQYCV